MKNKKGFTIIEILVVAVIIAVIGFAGTFTVISSLQKAHKETFLTDSRTVLTESNKKFSAEFLNGKITNVISSDEEGMKLDLNSNRLQYCVNLDDDGNIIDYKIANDNYYIEGKSKSNLESKNVKYGNFGNKITCSYVLDENDLLKEEVMSIDINSKAVKIAKIVGGCLIGAIILFFLFKSKNER